MEAKYAHIITIFHKINPGNKYTAFTYYEEPSFENASFGCKKNDIFKINNEFYKVSFKEILSSKEIVNNLIVKSGRHVVSEHSV